jgi:hypothetical protein
MTVIYDVGSLSDWMSAGATILATGVALYLAVRDDIERLGVVVHVVGRDFEITVVNKSRTPVVITDVEFQIGGFRPASDDSMETILAGKILPLRLGPFEAGTMRETLSYEPSYLPDRLAQLAASKSRFNRSLYVYVATASGRHKRQRITRSLREKFIRRS